MGIFSKAIQNHNNLHSGGISTLKNPQPWLLQALHSNGKGVHVSERTQLALSAFYAGVNIIANHVATLPLNVLIRDASGGTEDREHNLNNILKFQTNKYVSANHFKKSMIVNMLVFGNAFARIEKIGNKVVGLHLEEPKDVKIKRNKETGAIFYHFKSVDEVLAPRDVIHLYDFSLNGYVGLSVLEVGARNAFESHMGIQRFSKRYFENNAHIGGILSTPDSLGTDAQAVNESKSHIREEFENVYSGESNWFRTAILDGEWSYESIDVKASDAMLIEAAKATVEDISRWLGIPLSLLNHTDSQSFKSKEQEARTYVNNSLNPKLKAFEIECHNKLFTEQEKLNGYEIKIDTKNLVRANLKDTGEFLSQMIDRSIFSLNEGRDFLDMDTKDGLDIHLKQLNMTGLFDDNSDETNNSE